MEKLDQVSLHLFIAQRVHLKLICLLIATLTRWGFEQRTRTLPSCLLLSFNFWDTPFGGKFERLMISWRDHHLMDPTRAEYDVLCWWAIKDVESCLQIVSFCARGKVISPKVCCVSLLNSTKNIDFFSMSLSLRPIPSKCFWIRCWQSFHHRPTLVATNSC